MTGPIQHVDVARFPRPGTSTPTLIRFSPDGRYLTYLYSADGSLSRELYALEIATGKTRKISAAPEGGVREDKLSLEEKLRRERSRTRGLGITKYAWARDADRIVVPSLGDVYVIDGLDAAPRKVVDTEGQPALDVQLSRDGQTLTYVHDNEVFMVSAEGESRPKQLTRGARGTGKTNGVAEYIAQEEMGRSRGNWLSHDGQWLAYAQVDETHIPEFRIMHQGSDAVGPSAQENHRYPFAGAENAKVSLYVTRISGAKPIRVDLDTVFGPDAYLARVNWLTNGSLTAQVQNREQTELRLVDVSLRTGKVTPIVTEKSESWINLHHMYRPLEKAHEGREGQFIWASERTGFMHLYLYEADGRELRALTSGPYQVDAIAGVDEDASKVYFKATRDGVTESHLYEVGFDGKGLRKITQQPGMHAVALDKTFVHYIDAYSSIDHPKRIELRRLDDNRLIHTLHDVEDPRIEELALRPPRLVTVQSRDGETLYAAIYRPDEKVHGPGPYPTMVSVYGGPHAQKVQNEWDMTVDMRAQFLRQQGYLVFKLDNRGSARRGLAFESKLQHDMGNIELRDQVDGVHWLVEQNLAIADRVGMFGWSYGGYMSAMAVARAPETFRVGVAGAPVSHWDGYDTHYTERYMGTPESNPKGYEDSAVMTHVPKMQGSLLLVHGLIDENVHFRHTARLINALIAENKDFELDLYPDARHMPRKLADRTYMERKVFSFIERKL